MITYTKLDKTKLFFKACPEVTVLDISVKHRSVI